MTNTILDLEVLKYVQNPNKIVLIIFLKLCCLQNMSTLKRSVSLSLTGLSLLAGSIVFLSKPSYAGEVYLDQKCNVNQRLQEDDRFTVFYKSEFQVNGQKYWLSAARYQDGATLFCISKPNFKQSKILSNATQIQFQYIDKIVKDSKNNAAFLISVREGQNDNVPITVYRLNLSNPNRPVLVKVKRS